MRSASTFTDYGFFLPRSDLSKYVKRHFVYSAATRRHNASIIGIKFNITSESNSTLHQNQIQHYVVEEPLNLTRRIENERGKSFPGN